MNYKEFLEYTRKFAVNWSDLEKEAMLNYIKAVAEIETLTEELNEENNKIYLKEFMLPEDYMKILKDLRLIRIRMYYKKLRDYKQYLNKLEIPQKEIDKKINCMEVELQKKYRLKASKLYDKIL